MSNRKYPPISIHPILHGKLEVNWQQEYNGEFCCPYCKVGKITGFHRREKTICKLSLNCNSCKKDTYLTQRISGLQKKHLPISQHQTSNKILKINWKEEYNNEYYCPKCKTGRLKKLFYREKAACKLALGCDSCQQNTFLTCKIPGVGLKYSPISQHQTLNGILKIDWHKEYKGEYNCPVCNKGQLTKYFYRPNSIGNLALACNYCDVYTYLTCHVPVHISRYLPNIECPNPLCTDIGHDGQKGWVYKIENKNSNCRCYFCQITFNINSVHGGSWVRGQTEYKYKLQPFSFDQDIWELEHFYDNPYQKTLNFQEVNPYWYQQEVKKYLYYLLKSKVFSSDSRVRAIITALRQLGKIITDLDIKNQNSINRNTIIQFLDSYQNNQSITINGKLACIRDVLLVLVAYKRFVLNMEWKLHNYMQTIKVALLHSSITHHLLENK